MKPRFENGRRGSPTSEMAPNEFSASGIHVLVQFPPTLNRADP